MPRANSLLETLKAKTIEARCVTPPMAEAKSRSSSIPQAIANTDRDGARAKRATIAPLSSICFAVKSGFSPFNCLTRHAWQ